jgi:hypothetical protein
VPFSGYQTFDELTVDTYLGIAVPEYMYEWPNQGLLEYKAPGPPVWAG